MIPNKLNSTPIITSGQESCAKSSCFPHPISQPPTASNHSISTNFSQLPVLGMNPFLPNLLPSIALSYQLSLLASKPFQGLQNPLLSSQAFIPPGVNTLASGDLSVHFNPSLTPAQRIPDNFSITPAAIESSLKRDCLINNPFLGKIGSDISRNYPFIPNNTHIFNSYPDLWLDFQRKCQIMMEEMRLKEQRDVKEFHQECQASSQIDHRNNRVMKMQESDSSNSKLQPPFPSQILKLHSDSSTVTNAALLSSSPQSQSSPGSPDCKPLSISAYMDPSRALQHALKTTSSESFHCGNPLISQKQSLSIPPPVRERIGPSVTINNAEVNNASRYKCQTCKRSYSTATGLHKHKEQHCQGEQSQRQFSCQHCSKVYHSMSALKMHIRTHTLPCKCALCGKAFSRMWLLNGHIRTHTGEKPFSCHICARAFADRSNLRAHMQTHSEVKRYRCSYCEKTFSRMGLLTKHKASGCNARYSNGESNSFQSETSEVPDPSLSMNY